LAQSLARHSDIRLTMDRYSHLQQHERLEAVKNLPSVVPDSLAILSHTCPHKRDIEGNQLKLTDTDEHNVHNNTSIKENSVIIGENEESPGLTEAFSQWTEPGLNRRPKDFQSFALPAELSVLVLSTYV